MVVGFFRAFRGVTPRAYAEILNRCCNRFGWERSVVDSAPDIETIKEWAAERRMALSGRQDYRSGVVIITG
jgi:hypothetical protein